MIVGYRLIEEKTGEAVQYAGGEWGKCPDIPNPLVLPNGDHVCGANYGDSFNGYRLDAWEMDEPAPQPKTVFDGADFMARVTDEEYAAITGSNNIQVRRWLDTFRLHGEIDVAGVTSQAAKAGLVALGLLTPQRAAEIFSAQ